MYFSRVSRDDSPRCHTWRSWSRCLPGELIFELEGDPQRVAKAGEAFWEPGYDVIHHQDGNNLTDAESAFVVAMFCAPGQPMLVPVSAEELEQRRDRRAPRP